MNEQALIAELRNSLQATIPMDEIVNGAPIRVTKPVITDQTQREELTARYVNLLKTIEPESQTV